MSTRVISFDRFLRGRYRGRRRRLAEARPLFDPVKRAPTGVLNDRQIAHRQRMLERLRRYNG